MPLILSIETATAVCSSSLSRDGAILINRESREGQKHSSLLAVFVDEIMSYVRLNNLSIDAVAVSSGPGSYTGLRIGVSIAKGLSYGLSVPMIAIPTPLIMASMMDSMIEGEADEEPLLCPMIDARRMEVYATIFDRRLNCVRATSADIIDSESYGDLLEKNKILFFGDGAEKCSEVIVHPNAVFVKDIVPLASGMVKQAEIAFGDSDFVDSAYFEPFYLKDFVATRPKNPIVKIKNS